MDYLPPAKPPPSEETLVTKPLQQWDRRQTPQEERHRPCTQRCQCFVTPTPSKALSGKKRVLEVVHNFQGLSSGTFFSHYIAIYSPQYHTATHDTILFWSAQAGRLISSSGHWRKSHHFVCVVFGYTVGGPPPYQKNTSLHPTHKIPLLVRPEPYPQHHP